MSGIDDSVAPEGEPSGDWSVLYAPDAPLTPTACPDCGNVFATDSTSCPWCGRIVEAGEAVPTTATVAALAHGPRPRAPRPASSSIRTRLSPSGEPGARRWVPLVVAGAILLVIATGLTVRARGHSTTSPPATTTATASTAPAAATVTPTTGAATSTTATPSTVAATTAPPTTAATTTAPATKPSAATTSPAPPSTLGNSGSAVPSTTFTPTQQQALLVAQDFAQAIVDKNWAKVRQITVAPNATDAQYETYYGKIKATTVIPARVEALKDGTFDVWAGVVSVDQSSGADVSTLYCARYNVNLTVKTILKIATVDVRSQSGAVAPATVTDELRGTCFSAKFS